MDDLTYQYHHNMRLTSRADGNATPRPTTPIHDPVEWQERYVDDTQSYYGPSMDGTGSTASSSYAGSSYTGSSYTGHDISEYGSGASDYTAATSYASTHAGYEYAGMAGSQMQTQVHLPCECVYLGNCDRTFTLEQSSQWRDHIEEVHLRLKYPSKCVCWFCNTTFDADKTSRGDKQANFELRLDHIQGHFQDNENTVHDMRPDFFMIKHMYKQNIIDEDTYNHVMEYSEVPEEIRLVSSGKGRARDGKQKGDNDRQVTSTAEEDRRRRKQEKKEHEKKKEHAKKKKSGYSR